MEGSSISPDTMSARNSSSGSRSTCRGGVERGATGRRRDVGAHSLRPAHFCLLLRPPLPLFKQTLTSMLASSASLLPGLGSGLGSTTR
jgi:hypothetical protein